MESEISENVRLIQDMTFEKQKISQELNKIEYEISLKENEIQDLKILKIKIESLEEKKKHMQELENTNNSIMKDIGFLKNHLGSLQKSVFDLTKFENIFIKKKLEVYEAAKQEKLSEIKVAELRKEIQVFSAQINELRVRIEDVEKTKQHLNYLFSLEDWISQRFVPIISNIEKNVMITLKNELSKLFSEWFAMLVAESFNVRLDDNFTPIIEQHDYEIDYAYLSGGERTAIALAYRLALNQVINSLVSKIKTKDLVILDEPTDGFSDAQLDKMRSVLEQLNVAQLIIVSHEQKIEGFVENVMRFKKENGVSYLENN
jgi:exonuclease SbcC